MVDSSKIDLKRSQEINQKIILWFEYFINTPNIETLLEFYRKQSYLLYLEKRNGLMRYYGNDENIDHHSSNIEYVIKFLCHKILYDYRKNKILFDSHDLALASFCFIRPLYQNEFGKTSTDIAHYKVKLCEKQIQILRGILRMINNKDPGFELIKFESNFDYCEHKVSEFSKLSYNNKEKYLEFRQLKHYQKQWSSWWDDRKLWQWFSAESIFA